MKNAPAATAATFTPGKAAPMCCPGGSNRWLPLAAGIAIAGLVGLLYSSEKGKREAAESARDQMEAKLSAELSTAKLKTEEAANKATLATSELQAMKADMTGVSAKLKTDLAAALEAGKKASDKATETAAALDKANKALAEAKKEWSAKESALQTSVTALTEEASKLKRTAGEEASKAREALARLEEEKASAVKEATAAMADRDTLKAEVEKLRKQLESGQPKPAGSPQA